MGNVYGLTLQRLEALFSPLGALRVILPAATPAADGGSSSGSSSDGDCCMDVAAGSGQQQQPASEADRPVHPHCFLEFSCEGDAAAAAASIPRAAWPAAGGRSLVVKYAALKADQVCGRPAGKGNGGWLRGGAWGGAYTTYPDRQHLCVACGTAGGRGGGAGRGSRKAQPLLRLPERHPACRWPACYTRHDCAAGARSLSSLPLFPFPPPPQTPHPNQSPSRPPPGLQACAPRPIITDAGAVSVPGLLLLPGFVCPAEEAALVAAIDAQPWVAMAKRRVQHYGYAFDYAVRGQGGPGRPRGGHAVGPGLAWV